MRRRTVNDNIALSGSIVAGFVQPIFNCERDPEVFRKFWDKHKIILMDWWLTGKKLNTNEPVVTLDELEGRLFRRPELWWIFSATEPKKHYLATCKNKDTYRYGQTKCQAEDTGLYLARLGLLSDAEKKYDYKPYVNQEPDWKVEEVSPDHTAHRKWGPCSCWKTRLDRMSWKERLNMEYKHLIQ